MAKVYSTERDVVIVLRHDPDSSDPVDVAGVLSIEFFGSGAALVGDELRAQAALHWAIDREIDFIRESVLEDPESYGDPAASVAMAHRLDRDNFTAETGIWFTTFEIPLLESVAGEVEKPDET